MQVVNWPQKLERGTGMNEICAVENCIPCSRDSHKSKHSRLWINVDVVSEKSTYISCCDLKRTQCIRSTSTVGVKYRKDWPDSKVSLSIIVLCDC